MEVARMGLVGTRRRTPPTSVFFPHHPLPLLLVSPSSPSIWLTSPWGTRGYLFRRLWRLRAEIHGIGDIIIPPSLLCLFGLLWLWI